MYVYPGDHLACSVSRLQHKGYNLADPCGKTTHPQRCEARLHLQHCFLTSDEAHMCQPVFMFWHKSTVSCTMVLSVGHHHEMTWRTMPMKTNTAYH